MASKSSAVADEPIDVLFALQSGFNLMDFAGPLEVLTTALHDAQDPSESPPGAASLFPTPHLPLS
jgi:transcriptional regulator GlxA family with amidase domain